MQHLRRRRSEPDVAALLKAKTEQILSSWEQEARHELDPAQTQSKLALRDEIPLFLSRLAAGLSAKTEQHQFEERKDTGKQHGKERARQPDYTLEQVLLEYHLLRDIILSELECEIDLSKTENRIINYSIDHAMREAAIHFTELRRAQEQAEIFRLEAERDLREKFVATLSHDLRTPLTVANASATLILNHPQDKEASKSLAQRILSSLERINYMIEDLLDANRIEAGQGLQIERQPGSLRDVVLTAANDLNAIYGDRIVAHTKTPVHGLWSKSSIRRVIENLVNNAIKYGDPTSPVTVTLTENAKQAILSVHNYGNPISAEDQSTLFQQYRRSDSAISNRKKGWGLGLTLVRGLVQAHHGEITVSSSIDKGTLFTVILPKD